MKPGLVSVLVLAALFTVGGSPPVAAAEEVRASHILLRTREDALRVRQEILSNGGDREAFSAACRKYSMDAASKPVAGDVGWFPRVGKMDPLFSQAAFALKEGEISQPIKNPTRGWHLIFVKDRRDRSGTPVRDRGTDRGTDPGTGTGTEKPPEDVLVPERTPEAATVPPPVKATGNRRPLTQKRLWLIIESVEGRNVSDRAHWFDPSRAVELNLVLKNEGRQERRVPVPSLLPLGFTLRQHHDGQRIQPDFSSLPEPAEFFTTLEPYELIGLEVSINEYFRDLDAIGRFELDWSADELFRNLQRFPKALQAEGFAAVKADLTARGAITIDKVRRDGLPHWRQSRAAPLTFSILPRIRPGDKLFARLKVFREATPVWIELETQKQLKGSERFAALALEGFYDGLQFYEKKEDDYIIGGCPLNTGTGAPSMRLGPAVRNTERIPHVEGTVSFVSRNIGKGPVRGGEIGSIFFVTFKEHPEWNDVHVPFGKVVSGLEVLRRISGMPGTSTIESIAVLPESEYAGPRVAETPDQVIESSRREPRVVIKTNKGDLHATLYENRARNTVSNFVSLVEKGFYDESEDGGNQKFFNLMTDAGGKILIQAGSPTNAPAGSAGYRIPDEVGLPCTRGSLVMVKQWSREEKRYVPDTASSQFFICLRDIPYYDHLKAFTVFGKLDPASLEVLDSLVQGDEITEIKVTRKKNRDYGNFRKAP